METVSKTVDTEPGKGQDVCMVRSNSFDHKIVFTDGFPGCGKTMLSPIVSALDRVELLSYAHDIECFCALYSLGKLERDAAMALIKNTTDYRIYDIMHGRVNFRFSDLSSVFRDADPLRYIRRIFQKGDDTTPLKIQQERPILNLTTHHLLKSSQPIFWALGDRVAFIELFRHPLYMIKQKYLNMGRLIGNPKDFDLYISFKGEEMPYWAHGWEERFIRSNDMERAIYLVEDLTNKTQQAINGPLRAYSRQIVIVPFECFVLEPQVYIDQITGILDTQMTKTTYRMMKKQNVPRKRYAEGLNLKIYKQRGWNPPQKGSNENQEFELRWNFVAERASQEALDVLERLCLEYEQKYLGGPLDYKKTNSAYNP